MTNVDFCRYSELSPKHGGRKHILQDGRNDAVDYEIDRSYIFLRNCTTKSGSLDFSTVCVQLVYPELRKGCPVHVFGGIEMHEIN